MEECHKSKFENRGRYQSVREAYFHERTEERNKELLELCRDVEYIICELKRIEKRVDHGTFIPRELQGLCMQLRYWETRHNYRTDNKCLQAIAKEFHVTPHLARYYVFDITLAKADFLTDVAGGKEANLIYGEDEWAKLYFCPFCKRSMYKK